MTFLTRGGVKSGYSCECNQGCQNHLCGILAGGDSGWLYPVPYHWQTGARFSQKREQAKPPETDKWETPRPQGASMRNCCCFVPLWCLPCQNCPQVTSTLSFESCLREYGRESRACPAWKICRKWLCALKEKSIICFLLLHCRVAHYYQERNNQSYDLGYSWFFFSSGHEFSFA